MKTNEPKMILSISIQEDELNQKVKQAMSAYIDKLVIKELDDTIRKFIDKRIDRLLKGDEWTNDSQLGGISFYRYVQQRISKELEAAVMESVSNVFSELVVSSLEQVAAKRKEEIKGIKA